jgi:hypothetical protein
MLREDEELRIVALKAKPAVSDKLKLWLSSLQL